MNNKTQTSPQYSSIFIDNTWNYFAVSLYKYSVNGVPGCRMRFMANADNLVSATNCQAYTGYTVNPLDTMWITTYRNYIFNSMRIYQYAMSIDEIPTMVNTAAAGNCLKKTNQPQCTICSETGNCLTQCNVNQFEDPINQTCDNCDAFCGGCTKAGKAGCVYCARSNALVYYSVQNGNCSCISGYYYNSTNNDCELCNANCVECFGPTNTQCLTCQPGMIFYPPTYCIATCNDPLVIGSGLYGFYMATETIAGAGNFELCIKCHPYCASCFGTLQTQCNSCQPGFFLNGTVCNNSCPTYQYPVPNGNGLCSPCDPSCFACNGPLVSQCTTCAQGVNANGIAIPLKYLQGGVCLNQCNAGFYPGPAPGYVCQPCHIACQTCNDNRNTSCNSCNPGYFLQWLGFACQFSCVDGQYGDGPTNMCLLCHYSCLTCRGAGPDGCIQCAVGYLHSGPLCVSKCAAGEFIVNGACQTCDPKCITCYGPDATECYTCATNTQTGLGYYYYNNECMAECPGSFYPDNIAKVCTPCQPVCSGCTSLTFCTACISGPYQLNNGECMYFQCMTNQYRAVMPTLACYDCDPTCLTCSGMSAFDCLSCQPPNIFVNNTCQTCTQQPGMTISTNPNYVGCVEICGDGFNFGMVQCDDGNLLNGDGCNSKCLVEEGWNCTGGSRLMPDTCKYIQSPTPSINFINNQNQIYISFDEEVVITEDLYSSIMPKFLITVSGSQPSYIFNWTLQANLAIGNHIQSLVISLTFSQSLRGTEQVTVEFLDAHAFQDDWGNGIVMSPLIGKLNVFTYHDPFWSNFLAGIANYILAAIGLTGILNLIAAQLWGVSTTSLWTTFYYLQMATLVPLLSVNWPDFVDTFFGQLQQVFNGEITSLPNVFFNLVITQSGSKILVEAPISARFAQYGFTYSNIFYLAGRKILYFLILLPAYLVVWYMSANYADKHKMCKIWEKLELRFRFAIVLRVLLLSYVSLLLQSTLNIYKMTFATTGTTMSCFIAIAIVITLIYLPITIMNILQKHYDKMTRSKFLIQYGPIIDELDLSHPTKYMFYSIFLMRRIVFVFLIVLFQTSVLIAIVSQSAFCIFMILYVLIAKPFKRRVTSFMTILGEIFIMALYMVSFCITDPNQPAAQNKMFGFIIVMMLAVLLFSGLLCIIIQASQDLREECKRRDKKHHQQEEKHEEEHKYKKWKKRRQLVKRRQELKLKQSLLDQHEDLVNQYQKQLEEEEERRAREEEERERLENGEEDYGGEGNNNGPSGWQDEASAYMMQGYGDYSGFENQQMIQQYGNFGQQQQMMGGFSHSANSPEPMMNRGRTPPRTPRIKTPPIQQQPDEYGNEYEYGEYGPEEYQPEVEEDFERAEDQEPVVLQEVVSTPKAADPPTEPKSLFYAAQDEVQDDDGEAAADDGLVEDEIQSPQPINKEDQWE